MTALYSSGGILMPSGTLSFPAILGNKPTISQFWDAGSVRKGMLPKNAREAEAD